MEKRYESVMFSPLAYAKIMLHITRHAESNVDGFLIGSTKGSSVIVDDAVPLFHTHTRAPMLEVAAQLIAENSKEHAIVGYYFANEHIDNKDPPILAERVILGVENMCSGAVLVQIMNEKLGDPTQHGLQATIRSERQALWNVPLSVQFSDPSDTKMLVALDLAAKAVQDNLHNKFNDFDDHFSDVSKDPFNCKVTELLKKYM